MQIITKYCGQTLIALNYTTLFDRLNGIFDRVLIERYSNVEDMIISEDESVVIMRDSKSVLIPFIIGGKYLEVKKKKLIDAMDKLDYIIHSEEDCDFIAGAKILTFDHKNYDVVSLIKTVIGVELEVCLQHIAGVHFDYQLNDYSVNYKDEYIDFKKMMEEGKTIVEVQYHKAIDEVSLAIYTNDFNTRCEDIMTLMKFYDFDCYFKYIYDKSFSVPEGLPKGYKVYTFAYKSTKKRRKE